MIPGRAVRARMVVQSHLGVVIDERMVKVRNTMLVAALAATAMTAIGGFALLDGPPSRLLLDAGLFVTLAVIIVLSLSPTERRVAGLVEALRALARGERHQRVTPEEFAGLAEVARALNEVAASLTEHEDPNLGPVRSVPRPPRPAARRTEDENLSDHPELGPVRTVKRSSATGGASQDGVGSTSLAQSGSAPLSTAASWSERQSVVSEPRKSTARPARRADPISMADGADEVSEPRHSTRGANQAGARAGRDGEGRDRERSEAGGPAETSADLPAAVSRANDVARADDTGGLPANDDGAPRHQSDDGAGDEPLDAKRATPSEAADQHPVTAPDGAPVRSEDRDGEEPMAPLAAANLQSQAVPAAPTDEQRDGSVRDSAPARTNDTSVDHHVGAMSDAEAAASAESAVGFPSRAEIEALYRDFMASKRNKDEAVADLDLDAFAETISSECKRLLAAHQCKGVRFELAEVDGEVSLRPRLIR